MARKFAALAALVSLLTAGCTSNPERQAHDADATTRRQAAVTSMTRTLDAIAPSEASLAELRDDLCDPGQDSFMSKSGYKLRCDYRMARLLPAPEPTVEAAVGAMNARLAGLGCTAAYPLSAAMVEQGLADKDIMGMVSHQCGNITVMIGWVADNQRALLTKNAPSVAPPHGFTLAFEPFPDEALTEALEHRPVTWWVEARVRYIERSR